MINKTLCTFGTITAISGGVAIAAVARRFTPGEPDPTFWEALTYGALGSFLVSAVLTATEATRQIIHCYREYRHHPTDLSI